MYFVNKCLGFYILLDISVYYLTVTGIYLYNGFNFYVH